MAWTNSHNDDTNTPTSLIQHQTHYIQRRCLQPVNERGENKRKTNGTESFPGRSGLCSLESEEKLVSACADEQ